MFLCKKGDYKSLYKYIKTADYESYKTVMCNAIIIHR